MKACGLIVEYNPYHNGHQYHFQQARQITGADCMIAVMSGNFLQRGEPAIIDKYARAKVAIQSGIDLVVELPFFYAVQHSELFAQGAIDILTHLQTDSLCFGSEHGDISDFNTLYQHIHTHQAMYDDQLTQALAEGEPYPKAHQMALNAIDLQGNVIDVTRPNNILGYQYVKNIHVQQAGITPYTITRVKNNYHDQDIHDPIASATSIRNQLMEGRLQQVQQAVPAATWEMLSHYYDSHRSWHMWEAYFPLLKYRLLTMKKKELQSIHGIKEGIENRMIQAAKLARTFEEWMNQIKTKRYTWTSIQRMAAHLLTNSTASDVKSLMNTANTKPSVRVLAMNKQGQAYLKSIKKATSLAWYTSSKAPYPYHELDQRTDAAYYSILPQDSQQTLMAQAYQKPFIQ